jgi:thioredoxin 1
MSKLQVLDFYAEWCGPCRAMSPAIESLMAEHNTEGSDLEILKVNVDKENELSEKYGIRSIPVLVFTKDGEEVFRTVGAQPKDKIAAKIAELKAV